MTPYRFALPCLVLSLSIAVHAVGAGPAPAPSARPAEEARARLPSATLGWIRYGDSVELAPDGERVVFFGENHVTRILGIHAVPRAGGVGVNLTAGLDLSTHESHARLLALSADSRLAAFRVVTSGSSFQRNELFFARLDGSAPRRSVEADEGAEAGVLTSASFSRDGSTLAYWWKHATFARGTVLKVSKLDGGAPRQLDHFPAGDTLDLLWTEPERVVVLAKNRDYRVVAYDLITGRKKVLARGIDVDLAWQGQGRSHLLYSYAGKYWALNLSVDAQPAALHADSEEVDGAIIAPDGKHAVLALDLMHPDGDRIEAWKTVQLDGTQGNIFCGGGPEGSCTGFMVSPDGSRAVWAVEERGTGKYHAFTAPLLPGTAPVKIGPNPAFAELLDVPLRSILIDGDKTLMISGNLLFSASTRGPADFRLMAMLPPDGEWEFRDAWQGLFGSSWFLLINGNRNLLVEAADGGEVRFEEIESGPQGGLGLDRRARTGIYEGREVNRRRELVAVSIRE
jgi:hypothetical protein